MWQIGFTIVVLSTLTSSLSLNDDSPIASTEYGQLQGKVIKTSKGQCDTFLGVPFAAPPIGQLRFNKPQPPAKWTGIRNATEFGPVCIQIGSDATKDPKIESEDCLYLNIFVPNKIDPKAKLPVMVFIHGGAFVFGSAIEFGDNGICENLASRGVIVITIQYRLSLYGFLSTDDKTLLGNYAIWDQIESLKWIQRNIAGFGGDPQKVTIFGESAGGASVSLLTYTPIAKDLFYQSIAESGSALANWARPNDASTKELVDNLTRAANCSNANQTVVVDCLRQLSTAALQKAYNSFLKFQVDMNLASVVRVDGELFKDSLLVELKTNKSAIIGVNSIERPAQEKQIPQAKGLFDSTLSNIFPGQEVVSTVLKQATRYVYLDSKGDGGNSTFVCQQFARMVNDNGFRLPAAQEAVSKSAAGGRVWMYKFDYYSENYFPSDYPFEKGATHTHELCYIFLKPLPPGTSESNFTCPGKYEGDDRVVADRMGEMWTNFAIKGNPSPSKLEWPQFSSIADANTMHIRSMSTILPGFYEDVTTFWNDLIPSIKRDFDSVTPTTPSSGTSKLKMSISVVLLLAVYMYFGRSS